MTTEAGFRAKVGEGKQEEIMSKLEEKFLTLLEREAPHLCVSREAMVIPGRRFKFDFCFEEARVLVEINGGSFVGGRHVSGAGYATDMEKYRLATFDNWAVVVYTGKQLTQENIKRLVTYVESRVHRGRQSVVQQLPQESKTQDIGDRNC